MARTASGVKFLGDARTFRDNAKTAEDLRLVDGAAWHKVDFKLPSNLKLHFLHAHSPEINPQEHIWDELREKWFHNTVFDSLDALEDQLVAGLRALENSPDVVKSIAGWDWKIGSSSNPL